MLKNKELMFKLQDDDEVEEFMKQFYDKKNDTKKYDEEKEESYSKDKSY